MIALYILYALLGITIIIFIHEAGHFLAAKLVGIRVERFSLGFDPPLRGRNLRLLSFRRGETEYVVGLIPFGGYVKLAGEAVPDSRSDRTPAPDELLAKPAGARALVFVAGSAMNILSGFLFFMVAFTLGVSFTGPEIGTVLPGSPAWEAGIRPGDTVLAVEGEPVDDFMEMKIAVALAERGAPLKVRVSRPGPDAAEDAAGEIVVREVTVVPRWNEQGFNEVGVSPAVSDIAEAIPDGSPLHVAGLRTGDRIVGAEIAGEEIPPVSFSVLTDVLGSYVRMRPSSPFRLHIERDGVRTWISVTPGEPARDRPSLPQIGVLQGSGNVVRGIRPDSAAAAVLRVHDRLVAVDGAPVAEVNGLIAIETWKGVDGKLSLTIRAPSGEERTTVVPRLDLLLWSLDGQVHWGHHALTVGSLRPESPLAVAGIQIGDAIVDLGGTSCFDLDDLNEILRAREDREIEVGVIREGRSRTLRIPRAALEALDGVTWASMPPLAAVLEGGPAAKAGMTPGSRIVRAGGDPVDSWEDLLRRVTAAGAGAELSVAWVEPGGTERQGTLAVGVARTDPPTLPVRYVERTIQANPLAAVSLGAHRTVLISKQVFLTLRGLLRRDVSARNLAGPVGIIHQFTIVLEHGPVSLLLYWLALISVNLGLLNLLPFPILDGGHILFLAIEKIKGSPVDIRIQEWAVNIAFFLILFLAVFVTFNDVKRLFQ